MIRNTFRLPCLVAAMAITSISIAAELKSPDGKLVVALELRQIGEQRGCPVYSVTWRGKPILAESRLGLLIENAQPLDRDLRTVGSGTSSADSIWNPVYGERAEIRDRYNQLSIDLEDAQSRRLRLIFRAYDEGVAFCYSIPEQSGLRNVTITSELTQFRFTENHLAYAVYSAQGVYSAVPLDQIKANCERPLTVRVADDLWVAIAESRLVDYARMRLRPATGQSHTLEAMLGSKVTIRPAYTTPWRVVMVGEAPGQLLERNDLILNLNDPCAIKDTNWIRPGKVIREVTLSTAGGKACVDFAAAQGIQYVEYDAGWYGAENDRKSDATKVDPDPARTGGRKDLDLKEVIRYANEKGIGIILYVNHIALERQLDEILPLYQKWGVKGIKFGFVNVGSQQWTSWLHDAIRKAADHKLMVDVHDEYRPTGYSRTYPNLMTVEGVGGNETMPTAEHNCTLLFTRYLCGPADYTICWYSNRIKTTHAHQLALAVVYYSPWQFVYWYDRPQMYKGERETEFFRHVPTVWDDTRVIHGEIGRLCTIARRSGDEWYLGTINAGQRRQIEIPLTFLAPGRKYAASIYADRSPDGSTPTAVDARTQPVDATTTLKADLAADGGQAVRIVPAR